LIELAEYAGQLGVRLGLENRDHYCEIPLLDELDYLLGLGYDEVLVDLASCAARKYRTTRLILDNWHALAGWFGWGAHSGIKGT